MCGFLLLLLLFFSKTLPSVLVIVFQAPMDMEEWCKAEVTIVSGWSTGALQQLSNWSATHLLYMVTNLVGPLSS